MITKQSLNEAQGGESALNIGLDVRIKPDWKLLLAKYVAHVSAAEGKSFAFNSLASCDMLNLEFTEEDKRLLNEIFTAIKNWDGFLSGTQRNPLPIEQLFDAATATQDDAA